MKNDKPWLSWYLEDSALVSRLVGNLRSRRGDVRWKAVRQCFNVCDMQARGICVRFGFDPDEVLPDFDSPNCMDEEDGQDFEEVAV